MARDVIPWYSRDARDVLQEEVDESLEDARFFLELRDGLTNGQSPDEVLEMYGERMEDPWTKGYEEHIKELKREKGFRRTASADLYDEFTTLPFDDSQAEAVLKNVERGSAAPNAVSGLAQMFEYVAAGRKAMREDFAVEARRLENYSRDLDDLASEVREIDMDGGPWSLEEVLEVVETLEDVSSGAENILHDRADEIREQGELDVTYRELTDPVYSDRDYSNPAITDAVELLDAVKLRMDSIVPE